MRQTMPVQLPDIIQGGMGIGVSNWRLARRVAQLGAFGVVSGTALDTVLVRELQRGDPHDRLGILQEYPDPEIVAFLKRQYYVEGGIQAEKPYRLLPIHAFRPTLRSQRILSAATFSEIRLAKEGHEGLIGINFLTKLKRYTLPSMFGALLGGVDAIFMGAGIPVEEAEQLDRLANGFTGRLRLDVDAPFSAGHIEPIYYDLDPSRLIANPSAVARPMFFPIISSDLLARILEKKLPNDSITGWIIEGPTAGGHNAPPRGKQYDATHHPLYDDRDKVDLHRIAELGYPFYLAGGYGSPEKLIEARNVGAAGIQVGTLFSLTDESGYPRELKAGLIEQVHRREVAIRTDGQISSTGFPFKVVELEGTLSEDAQVTSRRRICDLGYLQTPFIDGQGNIRGRCQAEPVANYVNKGGEAADTERRACLCNSLTANIGLGQRQKWGTELPLLTAGDELVNLSLGSANHPSFTVLDVLNYLRGNEHCLSQPSEASA